MAVRQTVWDSDGNKCVVRSVDAAEIIASGGSGAEPVPVVKEAVKAYTLAEAIEQNEGLDESTEAKAKKAKGKKAE